MCGGSFRVGVCGGSFRVSVGDRFRVRVSVGDRFSDRSVGILLRLGCVCRIDLGLG